MTFTVGVSPSDQRLVESVVEHDPAAGHAWRTKRVAIIDIDGVLVNSKETGILSQSPNPVAVLHEKLRLAGEDNRVVAVILRMNTPGGTVTASDIMFREIERFKREHGKPVVVMMMDLCTSGGYYAALAGDAIVAYPTTVTGSIGVLVQIVSLQPALTRIGITADAIKSGPNKAAGNPFAPFTAEQRETFEQLVADFYQRFKTKVREHRPQIPTADFALVTDGRVFSGEVAKRLGLVDKLGDLYTAWAQAKQLAGVDAADLVIYHRSLQRVDSPYGSTNSVSVDAKEQAMTQINMVQLNVTGPAGALPAGFYYLWRPDLP